VGVAAGLGSGKVRGRDVLGGWAMRAVLGRSMAGAVESDESGGAGATVGEDGTIASHCHRRKYD
jgi:hypothetical protein